MAETSVARLLMEACRRDEQAFRALASFPEMNDAAVGFHAQQCIEKALKAVLAHSRVVFRRTHDIAELLDLLSDNGCTLPPNAERLDDLNPYAVEARYGLVEPSGLDRIAASSMIAATVAWAENCLAKPQI